ncbi:MAG: glycosyltransferase [Chloroflexi bacterium]|nr:glycosyltransferase [Chloroflexota bacterium]
MAGQPLLSVCLIVRDEERNLERCLTSLRPLAADVVVVDTGSRDGTPALAKRLGARLFTFAWIDDFAAARNASLAHARGKWIMWIDADEELAQAHPDALLGLLPGGAPAYLMAQKSLNAAGGLDSVAWQRRLVRSSAQPRFHGSVHEQFVADGIPDAGWQRQEAVWVWHYGYATDEDLARKAQRNLRLLEQAVAAEPENPVHRFNLGRQLASVGQHDAALAHLSAAVDDWRASGKPAWLELPVLLGATARTAFRLGRFDEVVRLRSEAPDNALSPTLLRFAGLAAWRLGQTDRAAPLLEDAVASAPQTTVDSDDSDLWASLLALAELYADLGILDRAWEHATRALQLIPHEPELLFVLALVAAKRNDEAEAVHWARSTIVAGGGHWAAQARRLLLDIGEARGDAGVQLEALGGDVAGLSELEMARKLAALAFARPN